VLIGSGQEIDLPSAQPFKARPRIRRHRGVRMTDVRRRVDVVNRCRNAEGFLSHNKECAIEYSVAQYRTICDTRHKSPVLLKKNRACIQIRLRQPAPFLTTDAQRQAKTSTLLPFMDYNHNAILALALHRNYNPTRSASQLYRHF
jgi:hypothetical protein